MKHLSEGNKLFTDFAPADKRAWKEKVLVELDGKPYEDLCWKTDEGFVIEPYFDKKDSDRVKYLKAYHHALQPDPLPGQGPRYWTNTEQIIVTSEVEANQQALAALQSGADGLLFLIPTKKKTFSLEVLLRDILLQYCAVSFRVTGSPIALLTAYTAYLAQQGGDNEAIQGTIFQSTAGDYMVTKDAGFYTKLLKAKPESKHFKPISIDFTDFHHQGGHAVQEIAFGLHALVAILDAAAKESIQPAVIFANISLQVAVGTDYFKEIAKVKVIRILVYELARIYNVTGLQPEEIHIHCYTSLWSKTKLATSVNMLRNTTEAMAAILGGCNALTILPHDVLTSHPTAFSTRIARNISNILREESHFNLVVDPSAGSYYLEQLSDHLIRESWLLFQAVEAKGEFGQAQAFIRQQLEASRASKAKKVATRQKVMVGTSDYIHPEPLPEAFSGGDVKDLASHIPFRRLAKHMEALRLKTATNAGRNIPKVLALPLSRHKMAEIRMSFTAPYFLCGGFETEKGMFDDDDEKGIGQLLSTDADIIVFCGSDEEYAEKIPMLLKQIKDPEKWILAIAGNPEKPGIRQDAIHHYIYAGSDIVETITSLQNRLLTQKT